MIATLGVGGFGRVELVQVRIIIHLPFLRTLNGSMSATLGVGGFGRVELVQVHIKHSPPIFTHIEWKHDCHPWCWRLWLSLISSGTQNHSPPFLAINK